MSSATTSTKLYTNAFEIRLDDDFSISEYSFTIEPTLAPTDQDLAASVVTEALKNLTYGKAVYDGGNRLITAGALRTESGETVGVGEGQGAAFGAVLAAGPGQAQEYAVTFRLVRKLQKDDVTTYLDGSKGGEFSKFIPALNVILHNKVSGVGKKTGSAVYILPDSLFGVQAPPIKLTDNLAARTAIFSTIVTAPKKLAVNASLSKRLVFARPVKLSELMLELIRSTPGGLPEWKNVIQGLEVLVDFHGYARPKVIKAVGPGTSRETTIEWGSKTMTVEAFHTGVKLVHGHDLPVVDVGTAEKPLYVPAELCSLRMSKIGQSTLGRLSIEAKKRMSQASSLAPGNATKEIKQNVRAALGFDDTDSPVRAFGITVATSLLDIQAKVLPAPTITYSSNPATVQNGAWYLQESKFVQVASSAFENAAVLGFRADNATRPRLSLEELDIMSSHIQKSLAARGIPISKDRYPSAVLSLPKDSRGSVADIIKKEGIEHLASRGKRSPSVLFVIFDENDDNIYSQVKSVCDVELGIPVVAVSAPVLRSAISDARLKASEAHKHSTFVHLAMKSNAKLGGLNHRVSFGSIKLLQDTMAVGISVYRKIGLPTLSTVVASNDKTFSAYPASVRMQDGKVRKIEALGQMFRERFDACKSDLPMQIVVFYSGAVDGRLTKERTIILPGPKSPVNEAIFQGLVTKYGSFDPLASKGVGNQVQVTFKGQTMIGCTLENGKVEVVVKHKTIFGLEVEQIQAAIKSRGKDYRPRLTIITCERGHHTQFFTSEDEEAQNAKAGTFVEEGITNIDKVQFYLQTQSIAEKQTSQTARCAKYTVIYDDNKNKLTAEELAQGINALCYASQTGTRSVSVVPPVRLAAKAASHARAYLHAWRNAKEHEKARKWAFLKQQADRGFVHDGLKDKMFYM